MSHPFSRLMLALTGVFCSGMLFAQEAAPTATSSSGPNSFWNNSELMEPLALVMITIILLLLAVMFVMGRILKIASAKYVQTMRKERAKNKTLAAVTLLLSIFAPQLLFAQATESSVATAPQLIGGISQFSFYLLFSIIIIEIAAILIMLRLFRITMRLESPAKTVKRKEHKSHWFERFNKTKSVAGISEEEVSTGHNYDGIKELDNPVPPWWKWGFYLSMVFALVYMYRFHIAKTAPLQLEELAIATEVAEKEVKAYLAASSDNVDENTVTLLTDAADIAAGQVIFTEKCASCHAPDGGGIIGPNLTDEYWLHGCSVQDIFKTIKYGVPEKGMISWRDQLSPKQIALVTSYVHGLKGKTAASPKEQQGDRCTDSNDENAVPSESTTATPDVVLK